VDFPFRESERRIVTASGGARREVRSTATGLVDDLTVESRPESASHHLVKKRRQKKQ
jgi:hypothetical protein